MMLQSLPPKEVKVNITIDNIRRRINVTNKKTIKFIKKSFFHTKLMFVQSYSAHLNDQPNCYIQKRLETYKSEKPVMLSELIKFI